MLASTDKIQIKSRNWLRGMLAGILFSWTLLLIGGPIYIADSLAYYKGGRAAVDFATSKFERASEAPASTSPNSTQEQELKAGERLESHISEKVPEATGVRSIAYSVMAYVLGAPNGTMMLLAIAQGLLTGLVFAYFLECFAVRSNKGVAVAAIVLAICTPLAFVSVFAVPDIYAGGLIAALIALSIAVERMSIMLRILFVSFTALAISVHASHPPLAAVVTLACMIFRIYRGDRRTVYLAWVLAPLVLGMAVTLTANRVGFGETSLAAKRYPLTLARSISDGPARWYLERHCHEIKYTVCEIFPNGFPKDITSFLFSSKGLENVATPAQMDQIRAEEFQIVLAAAWEYPMVESSKLANNFLRQLMLVQPYVQFHETVVLNSAGMPTLVSQISNSEPWWTTWIGSVSLITTVISLAWIVLRWKSMDIISKQAVAILILAILSNAAICVYFSGITGRYQARVIWLVPLLAFAIHGRLVRIELNSASRFRTAASCEIPNLSAENTKPKMLASKH